MKNYVSYDGYYGTLDRNNRFYPVGADVKVSKIKKVIEDNSILVSLEFVVGGEPQVIRCKFNDLQYELNKAGYPIANSQMANVKTTNIHKSIGWCGYGNELVFKGQKAVGITSSYAGNFNIKPRGKIADFRKDYKEVIFGIIPLEASMIMGLSACVVGYLSRVSDIPVPTLIFDINGKSTTGKTTSARLAVSMGGSVQSCSDKVSLSATCSTTANALYGILNDNFGYPMLFDETGRFGKLHNYMEMIYALADGTDKARMTKNGTISTVKHWATSVLFTGEAPMLDKADKADGLIVRVIPLSNVNWTENRSQAHLVEAFSGNYAGLPIQKLAKYICSQSSEEILALYKADIELLIDDIPVESEFKERIAKSAALLLLTAELAETALRIKFHKDDIIEFFLSNIGDNSSTNEAKKGFNVRALKCQNNGGRPPLGYMVDRETETFIINEDEAEIVRLIFDLYVKGYSYGYILNELNTRGYKTRLGNPFAKNSLHDLIKNKKYCGYYIFNRRMSKKFGKINSHKKRPQEEIIEIKGGIPAIISEETYNRAMRIMDNHKRSPAQNCAKHIYLLSGLVKCGHCREIMHGNTHTNVKGSVFHSYRCEKKHNKDCPNLEISQERLDDYVLKMLEENIFNERIFAKLIQSLKESHSESLSNYSREVEQIQANLQNLEARKSNIIKAISNGFIAEDFKEELSKIDLEREQIQLRLSEIHDNIPSMRLDERKLFELLGELGESVKERDLVECKHFIREFVDCVLVSDSRIEIKLKISSSIINGCNYTITKAINRQFLPNPHKRTAD